LRGSPSAGDSKLSICRLHRALSSLTHQSLNRIPRRPPVCRPTTYKEDLLIIEALTHLADDLDGTNAVRAARARRLARDLAADHGLDVADALFQIDTDVSGDRYAIEQAAGDPTAPVND